MKYIGVIVCIFTIILATHGAYEGRTLVQKWKKADFWLMKANTEETFNILVLGDSRIFFGVNPDILRENKNQKALNFAFPTISFTKHYLDQAGKLLAPNAHVYIGLTAQAFTNFNTDSGLTSFEKRGPLYMNRLMGWLRIYWPTINLELLIQRGQIPLFTNQRQSDLDIYHSNGWIESPQLPTSDGQEMAMSYRELFKKHTIKKEIVKNLNAEIMNWHKRGMKVTVFWTCFNKKVCEEEAIVLSEGVKESIDKSLVESGAEIIQTSPEKFSTFDGDHLIGSEAIRFSSQIRKISL